MKLKTRGEKSRKDRKDRNDKGFFSFFVNYLLSIILFVLFINALRIASAVELNLTINSKLNGFNSNFMVLTNPNASVGFDSFDVVARTMFSNYSKFYSNVGEKQLSVDVWNANANMRRINLTFESIPIVH